MSFSQRFRCAGRGRALWPRPSVRFPRSQPTTIVISLPEPLAGQARRTPTQRAAAAGHGYCRSFFYFLTNAFCMRPQLRFVVMFFLLENGRVLIRIDLFATNGTDEYACHSVFSPPVHTGALLISSRSFRGAPHSESVTLSESRYHPRNFHFLRFSSNRTKPVQFGRSGPSQPAPRLVELLTKYLIILRFLVDAGGGIEPARPFGQGILSSTQYCPPMFTE